MKRYFAILLMTLTLPGCSKIPVQESGVVERLAISLSTKSSAGTSDDTKDGSAFGDLLVIITDMNNKVVKAPCYKQYPYDPSASGNSNIQNAVTDSYPTVDTVYFEQVQIGTYKVFAYANTTNTTPQDPSHPLTEEKALTVGSTLNPDKLMKTLTGDAIPGPMKTNGTKSVGNGAIILTGSSILDVGVTNSEGSVELTRTACRVNVYVNNHANTTAYINELSFGDFNSECMYLIDHSSNGRPVLPNNNYRPMPAITGANIAIAANGRDSLVYSVLIYENDAPADQYKLYATAMMGSTTKTLYIKNANLLNFSAVSSMSDGETRPVLLVNPLTNNGKIMKNSASKSANFKGGDKPYVTSFVKAYADDSGFIFYLNKSGGLYNIYTDQACTTLLSNGGNLSLEAGAFYSGNSLSFTAEDFCNFKGTNYLYNNNGNFGTRSSRTVKEAQWAVYEPEIIPGSPLKIVDNVSSQVSTLEYMLRNQELNIILNIYYNQTAGSFNFEVDNTYWSTGHTMSHIYK